MNYTSLPVASFSMPGWNLRNAEVLKRERGLIGPTAFECGYRQKPYASGDRFFSFFEEGEIYWYGYSWRNISDPNHDDYDIDSELYVDPDWFRYTGVDLAGKNRRGTCIFTIAVSPEGIRHVLEIKLGAWDGSETAMEIQKTFDDPLLKARTIFVETNALQTYLIDIIKEKKLTCFSRIKEYKTGKSKMDPELGLPSINVQYEDHRWKMAIPHRSNEIYERDDKLPGICSCAYCIFVKAETNFTYEDLDAMTPDVIMAQFFAKEASRRGERFTADNFSVISFSGNELRTKSAASLREANTYSVPAGGESYSNSRALGARNKDTEFTDYGRRLDGVIRRAYKCTDCDSFARRVGLASQLPSELELHCPTCNETKTYL